MTLALLDSPALRDDGLSLDHPTAPPLGERTANKHPLIRVAAWVGLAAIAFLLLYMPASLLPRELIYRYGAPLTGLSIALPALVAYWLVGRFLEQRRPVAELTRPLARLGVGLLLGFALMCLVVGLIAALGGIRFDGTQSPTDAATLFWIAGVQAGLAEEVAFRGILLRHVEEGLGTWGALALSALLFGAAHLANPGATVWSVLAIAVEAGLLFGALYALTRSLWLCVGLHAAWNLTQGMLFSVPVSGGRTVGWLVSAPAGPAWLSGGRFGVEASVVTVALMGALGTWLCWQVHRRGLAVAPVWVRRRRAAVAG